ncbi:MerR family transcriptional regulator [Salinimicrobium tongyeongense]|jgi:DNA-binding transcriptional MerR regulator|uniref:MerR family transcriptional regulator n=1 Tax=Salinimicrobium tongyeongense TaxID=2809707 RepID=A0ABY6NSS0_9FLAO|nr:MerR family transcriptional regulator [Salinimicrobium tongyeongense]UZH55955.1 MerR family transcriptional regulator [Salinimicrobium tongyeongense]
MDQFSISQLSQFSGIKPHTIRIWEKRYNALKPHRSEGNTRYYDGEQLRRLLNIVALLPTGNKISKLCALSDEELYRMRMEYEKKAGVENDYQYFINQLIAAGMDYDEANFEKVFSHCLLKFGLEKMYMEIICPMLDRIGLMWSVDDIPPSQEHFISNLLRQKMFTAIDSMPATTEGGEPWLLFLPEDEFHELGLLFSNFLLRSRGRNVIYLGANVPLASVEKCLNDLHIENLLLFMVRCNLPEYIEAYLKQLKQVAGQRKIFVAGRATDSEEISTSENLVKIAKVEDLQRELKQIKVA